MSIHYPLAGKSLSEIMSSLSLEGVYKVHKKTGSQIKGQKISNLSELVETEAYEFYEINNQKYRLVSLDEGMNGRPFFMPYYEYGSHDYAYDAQRFLFRTHKKFEKALKLISTNNEGLHRRFLELTGGKAKNHNELIALLDDAYLIEPLIADGTNVWNQFIYSFLRTEVLALEMIEKFSAEIRTSIGAGNTPHQARKKLSITMIDKEARDESQSLLLNMMDLSELLYFPTNKGLDDEDLRIVFKEIASEAFKAPMPKGRETLFLMNRAVKIAGILECILKLEEKAIEAFPQIEKEIHDFFMSARRLATIRRRETDIRQGAKDDYLEARETFYRAFNELPQGYSKSSLAHVTDSKNALGACLQLRFPLIKSIDNLVNEMQGYCNLEL